MEKNRNLLPVSVNLVDISPGEAAVIAGIALILMTFLGPIANFFVLGKMIVPGNAEATVKNILASETMFRLGICIILVVAVLDVVVAWALFIFLKPVNKSLSLLTAWFRVVYATILAFLLVYLIDVLELAKGTGYLSALEAGQLYARTMLSIHDFSMGWQIDFIIFGIHLLLLGYLVYCSKYAPRYLGILLVIAGLGYMADGFGNILLPGYNAGIAMFTFIGEVVLMLWLLIRGRKASIVNKVAV